MSELAEYRSHKIVKAGKIKKFVDNNFNVIIEDCNGADYKVEMPLQAWARGKPKSGDYIIFYEDGYKSWSPAKAFEEGYTRI